MNHMYRPKSNIEKLVILAYMQEDPPSFHFLFTVKLVCYSTVYIAHEVVMRIGLEFSLKMTHD